MNEKETICQIRLFTSGLYEVEFSVEIGCREVAVTKCPVPYTVYHSLRTVFCEYDVHGPGLCRPYALFVKFPMPPRDGSAPRNSRLATIRSAATSRSSFTVRISPYHSQFRGSNNTQRTVRYDWNESARSGIPTVGFPVHCATSISVVDHYRFSSLMSDHTRAPTQCCRDLN